MLVSFEIDWETARGKRMGEVLEGGIEDPVSLFLQQLMMDDSRKFLGNGEEDEDQTAENVHCEELQRIGVTSGLNPFGMARAMSKRFERGVEGEESMDGYRLGERTVKLKREQRDWHDCLIGKRAMSIDLKEPMDENLVQRRRKEIKERFERTKRNMREGKCRRRIYKVRKVHAEHRVRVNGRFA